jgi:homoserine dehydrogenase
MDVITANKGPLAHAGEELHMLARQHGVHLRYESTVMDGLPVLNLAEFTLPAAGIRGFRGLLNRTSSIVLAAIEQGGSPEEAISQAQQIGVAEANPWHDLDGWDASMKTTILASTLLRTRLTPEQVQRTGIRDLPPKEIRAAALSGMPIRLVSSAQLVDGVLTAMVCPRRLPPDDPLFAGRESGILSLETEAMGTITLIQHDTGVLQTAYGVLSDLVTIQRARSPR